MNPATTAESLGTEVTQLPVDRQLHDSDFDDRAESYRDFGSVLVRAFLDVLLIGSFAFVLWWAVSTATQ